MTNTPSKEEVAKAQEWMRETGYCDFVVREFGESEMAELLASYAAQQRTDFALEAERQSERAESWAKAAENYRHELQAAESRLTSLREGLRRFVQAAKICYSRDHDDSAPFQTHVEVTLAAWDELVCGLLAEKKES